MTNTQYNQIKQTLKASFQTINLLQELENNAGASTSKQEAIETIIAQLQEIK